MLSKIKLESLWEKFHKPMAAFVRARVSNADAADDLVQDIFLRIHTRIDTLRDESKIDAWVYQIARNAITDYYRAQKRTVPLSDEIPQADAVEQDELAMQLAPAIRVMVNTLPPVYREAFLLTEINGMSQVELAARLGISVSGAKSRVQRARTQLRQMLLDCCHFEFDRLGGVINYYPHVNCCERCACQEN